MPLYLKSMLCKAIRIWSLVVMQLQILIFAPLIILHEVCHYAMAILLGIEVVEVKFLIPINREVFLGKRDYDGVSGTVTISRMSAHTISTLFDFLLAAAPLIAALPIVVFVWSVLLSKYNFLIAILGCICCYNLFPSNADLDSFSYTIRKNRTTNCAAALAWLVLRVFSFSRDCADFLILNILKYLPVILSMYFIYSFLSPENFLITLSLVVSCIWIMNIFLSRPSVNKVPKIASGEKGYLRVFPESSINKISTFLLKRTDPQRVLSILTGIDVRLDKTRIKEFLTLFPEATILNRTKDTTTYLLAFNQCLKKSNHPFVEKVSLMFKNNAELEFVSMSFKGSSPLKSYKIFQESIIKNFTTKESEQRIIDQFLKKEVRLILGGHLLDIKYLPELGCTEINYFTYWSDSRSKMFIDEAQSCS